VREPGAAASARGRVLEPGRNIFVCAGDVFALDEQGETLVAAMLATMMVVRDRPGLVD
jgi:acyl-coenzyme A thioesterase PaaI-like protein